MNIEPTDDQPNFWKGPKLVDDHSIVHLRQKIKDYLAARSTWRNNPTRRHWSEMDEARDGVVFFFADALNHGLAKDASETRLARQIIRTREVA